MAYVAKSIKRVFGDDVDIEIFKYPEDLEEAITSKGLPDVFMFSNYVWNQNLGISFAKKIKNNNPDVLVVAGGPNICKEDYKQYKFLKNNLFIDFYVLGEGEVAAVELLINYTKKGYCIESLKKSMVRQSLCIYNDELLRGDMIDRIGSKKNECVNLRCDEQDYSLCSLDDVGSPYLNGMMDKFFDNKLYPLVETNRGCPFSCTFCQQGEKYYNKVVMRSIGLVSSELEYIAKHMAEYSPGVARIEFADPNFAMFKQDLEITEHLSRLQVKYGWPKVIGCSTGKNKPTQVINAVEKVFPDTLIISNSMQSTNPNTLREVKRSNINLDSYAQVQAEIQSRGLRSMADVILGLPLETKQSHFDAVYSLIDSGVQEFTSYQAMVLKSTELEEDVTSNKFGLVTKIRLLPRAIGKYKIYNSNVYIAETETIVVETSTLSFKDYLESRVLHLITMIYHNSGVFEIVDLILGKNNIQKSVLINSIYKRVKKGDSIILNMIDEFIKETKNELFDSEEECINFYCNEQNLTKVKSAQMGANLLWKYVGVSLFECWEEVVNEIVYSLNTLLKLDGDITNDINKYLLLRVVNVTDDMLQSVKIELKTKFIPEIFEMNNNNCQMKLSDNHFNSIMHYKGIYANNAGGWSLMLAQLRVHSFLRDFQ